MELAFIAWNTSLSPSTQNSNPASEDDFGFVASAVHELLYVANIDVVTLCEVSPSDVQRLVRVCSSDYVAHYDGTGSVGKTRFDSCVFYRSDKLILSDSRQIISFSGERSLKVGQRLDFETVKHGESLFLFALHWPSRLWMNENDSDRHLIAIRLRDAIDELGQSRVIVLGDFNDEPFGRAIADQLKATRDRDLAARRRHLFYNPFWRSMAASFGADPESQIRSAGGSYFYKGGTVTQWHMFDQIIFSSAFLGNDVWSLRDESAGVLNAPVLAEMAKSGKSRFDHMPVMAVIEREVTDG